jgi:uncharacterized protein with von Willebrand factor type A (vWA) domain
MAFVSRLRRAGLRISVAETIDAMAAVEAAGIAREVLREALAAALVKDEQDRAAYDASFDEHFPLLAADGSEGKGTKRGPRRGGAGSGGASGQGSSEGAGAGTASATPRDGERSGRLPPARPAPARPSATAREDARRAAERGTAAREQSAASAARRGTPADARAERSAQEQQRTITPSGTAGRERAGTERPQAALARRPFADLDPDELDRGRAAAREIGRRFLARVSRRARRTRRGRVDIRRTIRKAVARGGALIDLQRRGRRPGKPDLIVLCDVSGSVARASDLLLTMLAAAEAAFARVTRFVFVDRLVPIDFVDGQIRPEGELDLHAMSDHGAVLSELAESAPIDRRTVLLVLGDARNNRRPARPDALRRLALRARAVVWAVPEPRARWNTGDIALASYAPSCDLVVEATSLSGLLTALRESAR